MLEKFITWFADRHLVTNLIFFAVFAGGVICWNNIKKEEMPDVTFDNVRISAQYPGATAEEVEHFVTKPIEEAVRGIDGIYRITSSAGQGSTSITVELEKNYPDKDEAITEIRNAVLDVQMPDDVRDDPSVRVFKTTKKAILDVAIYPTDMHLMDVGQREKLQEYAYALETQLLSLPHVNSVNRSGYLQSEIQILVDPDKLLEYTIPLSQVINEVRANHVRQPAGNIEDQNEPKVTLNAQLDTVDKLNALFVQAGFEGKAISLQDVAEVRQGFDREKEITKVNGHEAVMLNVVKNSSYGILDSITAVQKAVEQFRSNHLKGLPIEVVLLDDESIDVRNRLSIIGSNGLIGFTLILVILFLFLNKRSGLWVAMGIPFTMCFTLIGAYFLDYTINNTTLAAVIIVMGIVVDDAIVVAENVSRLRASGMSERDASIKGTARVFLPVLASVITTCIAFVPLFFFSGRFGQINKFIPPVIFLMLIASLIESLLILPGHMHFEIPKVRAMLARKGKKILTVKRNWFDKYEDMYGRALVKIVPYKHFVFLGFVVLMIFSIWIIRSQMKFVMFPNEETRDIVISGDARVEADRYETAELTRQLEDVVRPYLGQEVIGWRTEIARSRRGGAVQENRFRIMVEIVPREKRKRSADQIIALWQPGLDKIEGLQELTVQKSRWGQSSGSAIEILVQENNDALREDAANRLAEMLTAHPNLINVDIERPIRIDEYKIDFQREKIKRLAIGPADIASTFRAALEGIVLYELPSGDEEIDVRLTLQKSAKTSIDSILTIPVENRGDYLVPLGDVVNVDKTRTPLSISRQDEKRTTTVYADIKPKSGMTPLDAAAVIEETMFPQVVNAQPSTALSFTGEIQDTRETGGDFKMAIIMVLVLIYLILAVLFDSLTKPFVIMLAIPFGIIGVALAFWLHGKVLFGFFAAIGTLGMIGVVINDSIIMLDKLEHEFNPHKENWTAQIAAISQTRLRSVALTTLTTVAGVLPTAYGLAGYDAMLSEMMLALAWGLCFGTVITLILIPCVYSFLWDIYAKAGVTARGTQHA